MRILRTGDQRLWLDRGRRIGHIGSVVAAGAQPAVNQRSQPTFCGSARLAAHLNNHVGVNDDEQGAPVWICQQLTTTWQAIWPTQKHFS